MNSSSNCVWAWLRGFGGRLWFTVKLLSLLPTLILLFLAWPFWWLLTGKPVDPPKWMCDFLDGRGY